MNACICFLFILIISEEDIQKLLAAQAHIGTNNLENHMRQYVFKRRSDGTN